MSLIGKEKNDRVLGTIGWIGLGNMGRRMTRHLAKAGYHLVVADAVSTEGAPRGSTIADSNGAVGKAVEIVILSLPDGKATESVCKELIAASDRKVKCVIDTSTIGNTYAEAVDAILRSEGIEFVDSPVSGGIAGADKATLSVMMGCTKDTFERLKPMMSLFGKPFHVGTQPGHGQSLKLLNNFLSATALVATSEAIAFGVAKGLDMRVILDVVNVSSGRNTATMDKFPNRILPEKYDGGFSTALLSKDVGLYVENVQAVGSPGIIGAIIADIWDKMDRDMPGSDSTRIYPYIKENRMDD